MFPVRVDSAAGVPAFPVVAEELVIDVTADRTLDRDDEAKRAILKMRRSADDTRLTIAGRAGASRAVVVERKAPRRASSRASAGRRGLG